MIEAADLFCGAGGTSTGLALAAQKAGKKLKLYAVNHWPVAIETHQANHPDAEHYCESLDNLDPRDIVKSGRLKLLVASPECTHHSLARGGKPVCRQSRATAWHVLRWAEQLYIENILIENVKEFKSWGPIGANGRPLKSKRGALYLGFKQQLVNLGYRVREEVLNCANYGDPTTRQRLFLIATRVKKRRLEYPEATHVEKLPEDDMFERDLKPWVPAADIIDWSLIGESIFTRKKPLADKTMQRIEAGIRKFWGEPFLVMLYGTSTVRDLRKPLPTVTTSGGAHMYLARPFVLPKEGYYRGNAPRSVDDPLPTITSDPRLRLIEPIIFKMDNTGSTGLNARTPDDPLTTITTKNAHTILEPFIVPQMSGGSPRSVGQPVPTITTTSRGIGLLSPFLIQYYGNSHGASSIGSPLPTVTTKERHALIEAIRTGEAQVDIRYRMLQPNELSAAMSFPKDYIFHGTKTERVKQIGNAVPVKTAQALCEKLLGIS